MNSATKEHTACLLGHQTGVKSRNRTSALPPEPRPLATFLPRPRERGEDAEGKRPVDERAADDRAEKPCPAAYLDELTVISQEVLPVLDASGEGVAAERDDGADEEREMDRGERDQEITDPTPAERTIRVPAHFLQSTTIFPICSPFSIS